MLLFFSYYLEFFLKRGTGREKVHRKIGPKSSQKQEKFLIGFVVRGRFYEISLEPYLSLREKKKKKKT